jgi:SAM-dependent methyltransferase
VIYADDLAHVHHHGFGDYARRAAPEIAQLLERRLRHVISRGERPLVVEIGCGGGTLAAFLTARGFRVLGIDQSRAMIRLARKNAPGATFRIGMLGTIRIPRCHAIVAIGEVVNYLTGRAGHAASDRHRARLSRFFSRAARALTPGGVMLFDFMESAQGRTYQSRCKSGDGWTMVSTARVRGRILTRDIATFRKAGRMYRRSYEVHRVLLLDRAELITALRRAGFSVTIRRSIGPVKLIRGDAVVMAKVPHNFRPGALV